MKYFITYIFFFIVSFINPILGQSVLKTGQWVKVKTTDAGIYKVSYDNLIQMGFTNPTSVQIFGNGGKELSQISTSELPSVLHEIAIWYEKGSDGIFNSGDYILFYAESPDSWDFDTISNFYKHNKNLYADVNYYYITVNRQQSKLISQISRPTGVVTKTVTTFDDLYFYEKNETNVLKSGSQWFEYFSDKTITFSIPDIITSEKGYVTLQLAGRHPYSANFGVAINGTAQTNISLYAATTDNPYAVLTNTTYEFIPNSSNVAIQIQANFSGVNSKSYIDYCELQVTRKLKLSDNQMHFRDYKSVSENALVKFEIENSSLPIVWDITNPDTPLKMNVLESNSTYNFIVNASSLHEYIVSKSQFKSVEFVKAIENQDLLSETNVDMIIIANSQMYSFAQQIADVHLQTDGLKTKIVSQDEIFTEFSAGRPDVSAIRNYLRYVYKKSGTLQFVLLFGDGSYKNNEYTENQIQIQTFQSHESLRSHSSIVADDYFAMLGDNEGVTYSDDFVGEVDIAVGRFPVNSVIEAEAVTNKTIQYITNKDYRGSWQNNLCFLGDDADDNQLFHMKDADNLTENIHAAYPNFNFDKIYLDAYPQIVRGSGQRYPDVNNAISERMKKGCLVFNYTGHGSEVQMTAENVINATEIESWKNETKLPLFITASCEIAKFDNPEITSLGEKFLLQYNGGAIALFTTTRVVYAFSNYSLNNQIYKYLFTRDEHNKPLPIGKAFILAKKNTPNDINQNKRNFTLLGDPALRLAVPELSVVVDSINSTSISFFNDTLKANSVVSISGKIKDLQDNFISDYNGDLYIKLFDKPQSISTLGNDGFESFNFESMKNILFQGKAYVKNGLFSFEMIIPNDILYYNGKGKLSLYVSNRNIDGAGNVNVDISGSNENMMVDNDGPLIRMFMNDTLFVEGNVTNETPTLLVALSDISGINISDALIGHSITLIIDGDESNPINLNDFYYADFNTYKQGIIEYPFSELEPGEHTITIKVWDTQNNMTEQTFSFIVIRASSLVLQSIYCFPNPVKGNGTTFHFEHNQANEEITVRLMIFDILGNCVVNSSKTYEPDGYIDESIYWDGKTIGGANIESGVYTYTITVESKYGKKLLGQQKMLVLQ